MFLSCHVRVFRLNPHSVVAWMSRNSLLEAGAKSEGEVTATGFEFLDIQATTECGFSLKHVRDMIKTYSQMHRTDKYSQHSSIIWPAWLNGWVFVYELSGCGFESSCSHFTLRFRACFEQGVPWHSGNYRMWIQSETRTWHDKNIQSIGLMLLEILEGRLICFYFSPFPFTWEA